MPRIVKVAIIGSGLAGLTAAHLLSSRNKSEDGEVEFQVHLFDKVSFIPVDLYRQLIVVGEHRHLCSEWTLRPCPSPSRIPLQPMASNLKVSTSLNGASMSLCGVSKEVRSVSY